MPGSSFSKLTINPAFTNAVLAITDAGDFSYDLLVIATPHREYANLEPKVPTVDIQNLLGRGVTV